MIQTRSKDIFLKFHILLSFYTHFYLIRKLTGDHLERIAFEFCQLKNSLSICSGDAADSSKQNNVNLI